MRYLFSIIQSILFTYSLHLITVKCKLYAFPIGMITLERFNTRLRHGIDESSALQVQNESVEVHTGHRREGDGQFEIAMNTDAD